VESAKKAKQTGNPIPNEEPNIAVKVKKLNMSLQKVKENVANIPKIIQNKINFLRLILELIMVPNIAEEAIER
jgi:hypothetical protein